MSRFATILAAACLAGAGATFAQQTPAPAQGSGTSVTAEGAKPDGDAAKKQARKERREHRKAISHRHRRKH